MSRSRLLFVTCAALLLALPVAGDRPAPQGKNDGTPSRFVGRWTVTFANGVVEKCDVRADGTVRESEPKRSAVGKAEIKDDSLVITFADDRVERWTAVDKRMVVEHWFPAAAYPVGARVLGIADSEKGQEVLTGKATTDNMEVRLVAAKVSNARGQNLLAKFVPLKGEQKEFTVRFPAHSHTTHETTIMNVIYSSTAPRQGLLHNLQSSPASIKAPGMDKDWKEASLEVVLSLPKDFGGHYDFSHWYVVSIKVRDKK
jgi:hypothetical protein